VRAGHLLAQGEAVTVGPIEISGRIVGERGESVSGRLNFVVVLVVSRRVELSSHFGPGIWDVVGAGPSGIVNHDFGLVFASQLERSA
jgi:hypothetical protein